MKKSSLKNVKKERKKSFFLQEISNLIRQIAEDEPLLTCIFPVRVELSEGERICYVYFSGLSKEAFKKALEILKLYKPSLKKALAKAKPSKHTPDLTFKYDESLEKARRMDELLDKIKKQDPKHKNN